ncbi:MAG TPA: hypothetical protein VMF55_04330 [Solirubrobacterales bacterium]|nr:hypothetical protein [Solirubrobacterales bacterium]
MAKKRDEELFRRLRDLGVRKSRARKVSQAVAEGRRNAPKAARRAISDLTSAAAEVQDRINKGPAKRKEAARKAARTRKRQERKRSASAKKAARTRAQGRG